MFGRPGILKIIGVDLTGETAIAAAAKFTGTPFFPKASKAVSDENI